MMNEAFTHTSKRNWGKPLKAIMFCSLLLVVMTGTAQNDTVRDDEASNFNLNKPEREQWLRNTGAGLFIHFSVDAQLGVVISHSLVGASDDYVKRYFNDLPKTFNPSKFNPYEIAVLAKLAGMKYIVFTTKHHSGFCMWDTKTTSFNIMNTPYKKDLLKEFTDATRAAGLAVGFYFSPEDFHFLYEHHLTITRTNINMDVATQKLHDDFTRRQCEELMRNYGKIDVLFIDGEPKDVVKTTCWKLQPDILITRGAIQTPEQILPGVKITKPWLSCITMGTAWQYQPTNERYKSGKQLIELAVEARSKGGTLLLNVGPKPNGELPIEQEERLREMAAWNFVNQECMDSVRPWVVSNEGDILFTLKEPSTLYAIVTDTRNWKEGQRKTFLLHSVKSTKDTRIDVLGQNSKVIEYKNDDVSSRYRQNGETLEVSVVKAQRIYDDHRWPNPVVIRLEHVAPVFQGSITVLTEASQPAASGVQFTGKVVNRKSGKSERACFYYRPYNGQVETLYSDEWKKTAWTNVKPDGSFNVTDPSLDQKKSYEYKAVAEYFHVEINGENRIYRPRQAPPNQKISKQINDTNMTNKSPDEQFASLNLTLPPAPEPLGVYKPGLVVGKYLYLSGHGPVQSDGTLIIGRIGRDMDEEQGKAAARQVGLTMLSTIVKQLGSLDKIKRVVKVLGMVNCMENFKRHPYIINGCSELFAAIWGEENGIGVRSSVGMGSLPDNIPVEIEAVFELK